MTTLDVEQPTARAQFRARLSTFAEEHPELSAGEMAEQFAMSLPDEDRSLVNQFLTSEARNILAWEMRAQFGRTRRGIFAALDITNPDRPVVEARDERARETLFDRITQWREYVPSINRTELVMTMNRSRLLESAQFDAGHVAHYGWKMMLKTKLADGLPDDASEVHQIYTPDQVATLGESIRRDMNRGNFRLKIQPVRPISRTAPVQGQTDGRHSAGSEADRSLAAK